MEVSTDVALVVAIVTIAKVVGMTVIASRPVMVVAEVLAIPKLARAVRVKTEANFISAELNHY